MPTVVTSALPYANGPIHLGHLVEYIQADIFYRFLKMTGEDAIYVCADDAHGTAIELKAREMGIKPEELIEKVKREHILDFDAFQIGFDIFSSTHSSENRYYTESIYKTLKENNSIVRKTVEGLYCTKDQRFLPDRYVRGRCPKCNAANQYGDNCEACGATYDPSDLIEGRCSLCGERPVRKESEHLYFQLSKYTDFLRDWIDHSGAIQEETANFVRTWIKEGLKDWCISRDEPYFGFPIPGEKGKFFYVWLDAPIGYISSTARYCEQGNRDLNGFWRTSKGTIYHFIGKDISYFHILFWPAILKISGFNLPKRIIVHGFLTVNGQKMSKSRGTFITANQYLETMGTQYGVSYLRYYYASKLTCRSEDMDLNIEDFRLTVNANLVNNFCNFHNRSFTFCFRYFEGKIGKLPDCHPLFGQIQKTVREVEGHYRNLEYNRVIEKIHFLGDVGNRFFQNAAPWEKVKTNRIQAKTDITFCVNLVKVLGVMLKPVLPDLIAMLEKQMNFKAFRWSDARMNLDETILNHVEKLTVPIDAEKAKRIIQNHVSEHS